MCLLFFIVLIGIWCPNVVSSSGLTRGLETTGNKNVERSKRAFEGKYLVFPEGSNVQLVYCMTISTYTKPEGFFNIGLTAGQAWQLPSKSTLSKKFGDYHRRSRRQLYRKDGKACVLKTICNAASRSQTEIGKGHFMQEILHAMFS
ncbi:unnamed protein product, partial [Heterotrigona itama]